VGKGVLSSSTIKSHVFFVTRACGAGPDPPSHASYYSAFELKTLTDFFHQRMQECHHLRLIVRACDDLFNQLVKGLSISIKAATGKLSRFDNFWGCITLDQPMPATNLDLSRFSAAPSARLSHPSFKSDGAFPA
jgi:hypothetical protein